MDSIQRRLHAAGRNPEGLEVEPPDAEGDRADHQQQIEQFADLPVAVRRCNPLVPLRQLLHPGRIGGARLVDQRIQIGADRRRKNVVVCMAAEPHLRDELVHRLLSAAEDSGEIPPQKSRILPHGALLS
ncbi:MAG: hypothetical protein L6W00_10370 [Lentisphaeria bacterium]|nr:MAG: hypothetical protein L6W00_10370 [Lentisphaeria bacterium]